MNKLTCEHCPVPLETIPVLVTEENGSQRMALLGEFLECAVVEVEYIGQRILAATEDPA